MNKKKILGAMLVACAIPAMAGAAVATPLYDARLEAAAQRKLSERLGALETLLRGGFETGRAPEFSKEATDVTPSPAIWILERDWPSAASGPTAPLRRAAPGIDRVIITGSVVPIAERAVFPALPSARPYPNEGHAD